MTCVPAVRRYLRGRPFGYPPLAPFARAAAALASERTLPPFRPSATAAGFLRGTFALDGQFGEALRDLVHGLPVALMNGNGAGLHQLAAAGFHGGGNGWLRHGFNIPNRLGFV